MVTNVMRKMIRYFGEDVKRINHALKVYGFAQLLSDELDCETRDLILYAALLHDIGIKNAEMRFHSSAGNLQEIEGPPVAREILGDENLEPAMTDRICFLIGNHHSYQKIDGMDFQILIESDFLVNIFEDTLTENTIQSIRKKYFKTDKGIELISNMYGK